MTPTAGEARGDDMNKALEDIAAERQRQIDEEGWKLGHDDKHDRGQMACAAACYAFIGSIGESIARARLIQSAGRNHYGIASVISMMWPWGLDWWKPTSPRRDLVKAGALIVAEIERLDRISPNEVMI